MDSSMIKMEGRWLAFVTAVALFFGGWWLQNQYDTTLRLQQQVTEYMRFVDEKYVDKDYMSLVASRLDKIDAKLEALRQDLRNDEQRTNQHLGSGDGR